MRRVQAIGAAGLLALCAGPAWAAGKLTDAESATHGDEAASHQVVATYPFAGGSVTQFNLAVLSHYSYILVSGKEALIVDPDRDVGVYLDFVRKQSLKVKGVFLTHSHADFVAGHTELVRAFGCPIHQSAESGAGYTIVGLKDGSTIAVGTAVVRAMATPGHTPDGMCAAVFPGGASTPAAVFTGDTLFIGSVGRPDLLEGSMTAASLASMGYDSWRGKLGKLPDATIVLPAHGAGSLCGAHLSDKPSSTIGEQRVSNPYLQHKGRSAFVAAVLDGLPEAPQYFRHNAAMNRKGPAPVVWDAPLPAERTPDKALTDTSKCFLADVRDAKAYAAAHVPNSVNIGLRGRFETWIGTMVPWDADLVLVGDAPELKEAIFRLHRVGYKAGVLTLDRWRKAGLPVRSVELVKPAALYARMQAGDAPIVVDVRLPDEWMGLRIGTVVNLPVNRLADLSSKLDPSQPVVTVCNSAYRSSMAMGVLEAKGFKQVTSMDGGGEAWIAAGLPVFGAEAKGGAAPAAAQQQVDLADRISPADLKRLLMDLPGTFDLVDIRPDAHFADYSLPGARRVDIADLMHNPAYLTGAGPLVIVDRDGSLAMQIGGILSQKTKRVVKVLHGGLEAYWRESELTPAVKAVPLGRPAAPAPAPQAKPAAPAKKKSAGC